MNEPREFTFLPQNPYLGYSWLRSQPNPYFHESEQTWLVSRYEQVAFVLRDPRFSKELPAEDQSPLSSTMLFQDPPNHRRLRDVVVQAFTALSSQNIQHAISIAAERLINQLENQSSMDFIKQFASPFPIAIMADLLGIEPEFNQRIHDWTEALVKAGVPGENNPEVLMAGSKSVQEMGQFFSIHVADHSSMKKDNLMSALKQPSCSLPHGRLSHSELAGTCMLLMIAGHETTVNLLGNGLYLLLTHSEQLLRLREDPTLMPDAIEEVLRYESPVQRGTYRCTKEPVKVGEVIIPAGANVTALIGAANRDPAIFNDPESFLITRKPNPHLGFGQGIHFCLGASLAREEASIAFRQLFSRLSNLRLKDMPKSKTSKRQRLFNALTGRLPNLFAQAALVPRWDSNTIVRGLKSLPIEW